MSDNTERIKDRLENLQAIEPIVGSMRVLAMSSMQFAINRLDNLQVYKDDFTDVYSILRAGLKSKSEKKPTKVKTTDEQKQTGIHLLIILGSDRGICGTYNKQLIAKAQKWQATTEGDHMIIAFGSRLIANLHYSPISFDDYGSIVQGTTPRYDVASNLIDGWFEEIQNNKVKTVDVLSFRKSKRSAYKPVITHYLPEKYSIATEEKSSLPWPPPIIEGDASAMMDLIGDHLLKIRFYELILESMIAENTIRYRLLEEAKENTEELIEELSIESQMERRKEITAQIQEIAVSAGLTS